MVSPASVQCPALFFCAPASGQGKTTITAGIARYHKNQGRDVRVFKTGPDYLDPLILERACGHPVAQLDLWMVGEKECQQMLYEAATQADLILIEGVMGMFDGHPSGADLSACFGMPVAIVIDASSMAGTFGAIALGLAGHRPDLSIAGVIGNNLASQRHQDLVVEAMPSSIPLLGCVRRHTDVRLPERHLGLVHPHEVGDMDYRLDRLAEIMDQSGLTKLPPAIEFHPGESPLIKPQLQGRVIAIARDDAFTFIYAANIKLLQDMGATCVWFSPLVDEVLPDADVLWLPGGYPELHSERLSKNRRLIEQITRFCKSGKTVLAECGGMLYLMESLTDIHGQRTEMLGLIAGHGFMRERGGCQGMQTAPLPCGDVRAHAHHRTRCEGTADPVAFGKRTRHEAPGEPIYQIGNITASYLHLYFPSNPDGIATLFTDKTEGRDRCRR